MEDRPLLGPLQLSLILVGVVCILLFVGGMVTTVPSKSEYADGLRYLLLSLLGWFGLITLSTSPQFLLTMSTEFDLLAANAGSS